MYLWELCRVIRNNTHTTQRQVVESFAVKSPPRQIAKIFPSFIFLLPRSTWIVSPSLMVGLIESPIAVAATAFSFIIDKFRSVALDIRNLRVSLAIASPIEPPPQAKEKSLKNGISTSSSSSGVEPSHGSTCVNSGVEFPVNSQLDVVLTPGRVELISFQLGCLSH